MNFIKGIFIAIYMMIGLGFVAAIEKELTFAEQVVTIGMWPSVLSGLLLKQNKECR